MTHFLSRKAISSVAIIVASAAVLLAGLTPQASAQANDRGAAPAAATDAPDAAPYDPESDWIAMTLLWGEGDVGCGENCDDYPAFDEGSWPVYDIDPDVSQANCYAISEECGLSAEQVERMRGNIDNEHQALIDSIWE
ncbi:hypothetical protein [Hyphomonas johnsonii]|uniref:Lipoprotein n=1 Tax=Hyphomonas johnsonii MHS-2 TaxID=1280950 RepID=A0A059FQB2_9PROT|nr:hypothetical protein [Hyphomonas johnsonii]KCZ92706.1 hypothetical protein HJO_07122 [Hyphomonas johnsonii MHS-2]